MAEREKSFVFTFDVSEQFLRYVADSERWLAAQRTAIENRQWARGPRGGAYRLLPGARWSVTQDDYHFMRLLKTHVAKRRGRYVRPDRVPKPPESITFDTFTFPVRDGVAVLPDGRRVEVTSPFVAVPVVPGLQYR